MKHALGWIAVGILVTAALSVVEASADEEAASLPPGKLVVSAHQVTIWALQNNMDLSIESLNPQLRHADLVRELSVFDPAFYLSTLVAHQVRPLATTTVEGEKKYLSISREDRSRYESFSTALGLRKKLSTGGVATVEFGSGHSVTKDLTPGMVTDVNPPVSTASFTVKLSHPLLRGRGGDYNLALVCAARNNEQVAYHNLETRMIKVASLAQQAYWGLVFARSNLLVKQESLQRAQELLDAIRIQVRLGKSAEIELTRARANVAAKREGIISALKQTKDVQDQLRTIINLPDDDLLEDIEVVPVDDGLHYEVQAVHREQAVFQALSLRPDLEALHNQIENRRLDRNLAHNQLLPRLDIDTGASVSGWEQDWPSSLEFLPKGSFYSWQVKLNFELPIDNRAARTNYTRSKLLLEQELLRLSKLEDAVVFQVKQSVRQVHTNLERIKAAHAAQELADEAARKEKAKYEEGISTFLELREAQEALAQAQSREVAAVVDYHISLALLEQATGTVLSRARLLIKQE